MTSYKFRAECIVDVMTWILLCDRAKMNPLTYTISKADESWPDVEVEYTTDVPGGLIEPMYSVSDGHVMIESHAPADLYTGERNEDLEYPSVDPVELVDLVQDAMGVQS